MQESLEPLKTMLEIMTKFFVEKSPLLSSREEKGKMRQDIPSHQDTDISFGPQQNQPTSPLILTKQQSPITSGNRRGNSKQQVF